jgi:hypothetical protein
LVDLPSQSQHYSPIPADWSKLTSPPATQRASLLSHIRLVATKVFGGKKALFSLDFVKFFAEYTRFRLQKLPCQSKKMAFFPTQIPPSQQVF